MIRDALGLVAFAAVGRQSNRCAAGIRSQQALRLALFVVFDEMIGDGQNVFRAAIIVFELDDLAAGVVFFEFENVIEIRPRHP